MIQLYWKGNSDFTKNGDFVLQPMEARTRAEINGEWSAEITCPIDDEGTFRYIEPGAVVRMPSYNGEQLYRIRRTEISDEGIEAEMVPIFFDSAGDCFLIDTRPTNKTGQQALDIMTANSKYSGISDIETTETAYYQYANLMEAISGDSENAFLTRWGGEVEFDNFTVKIMNLLGEDNGLVISAGKNILENGFRETIDASDSVTRIYPVAYNGRHMSNDGYVTTEFESDFAVPIAAVIEYPNIIYKDDAGASDWDDPTKNIALTLTELDVKLRRAAWEDLILKRMTFLKFTDEVDFADIRQMQGYSESPYKDLETLSLGDVVRIKYPKFGLSFRSRVVSIEYDSVMDRINKITLSDDLPKGDYFRRMNSTVAAVNGAVNSDGSVKAAQMAGAMTQYVTWKSVHKAINDYIEVMRLGDAVTLRFNAWVHSQASGMILQSWTIPEGYRPAGVQNFYVKSSSGMGGLALSSNGDVRLQAPDTASRIYSDSISYRTEDAMPAI